MGLLRRLFGGDRDAAGTRPGPSREEIAARIDLQPGLREFVAGTSRGIAGEHPAEDLARAATWLTYLGERRRAEEAWGRAAIASLPAALLNDPHAPSLALLPDGPVRAGTDAAVCTALAGDQTRAVRVFERTLEVFRPAFEDGAGAGEADWSVAVSLAYCCLRSGAPRGALSLLAYVPGIHNRPLGDAVRLLAEEGGGAGEAAGAALLRVARETAEAQPYVLDLQGALPQRAPAVLPPSDLAAALAWEDEATERRRARPWRGDIRLLDNGHWLIAQSHEVLRDGEVDGAALSRLILPGSRPPAVNREGLAGILRGAVRFRGLSPADEAAALAALDRGELELVVFAGGAAQPFAPALAGIERLETPGGGPAVPIRFVTDPGG